MIDVIPTPLRVAPERGQFRLRPGTRVEYANPTVTAIVDRFCREGTRRTGHRLEPMRAEHNEQPGDVPLVRVELARDSSTRSLPKPAGVSPSGDIAADERYALTISDDGIVVRGAEPVGVARGLTTLLQLLATTPPDADGVIPLPAARIIDAPRFAWRGLTLDVARTYFTPLEVRRVIDLLALYKFNVLHLHLTNDQAWRIEAGRPPDRRGADGSFYTNAELRALVTYAEERFVTLVPEADTPGHATALIGMHPKLDSGRNVLEFNTPPPLPSYSAWLDPDLPTTFAIVEPVLADLAAVFSGPFVHIGSDQPFGMREDLYVRYVNHVRAYVQSLGKRTIGYQESIRAAADPDHVIQYWISATSVPTSDGGASRLPPNVEAVVTENIARSRSDIETALKNAVPVIVSPASHAYLDVPYAEPSVDSAQEELKSQVGQRTYKAKTIAESFDWEPVAALGRNAQLESVAGVSAAIWCETIKTFNELTFMLLPRLAGIAQKGWSDPRAVTWSDHRQGLAAHGRLWDQDDLTYFKSSAVDWSREAAFAKAE